MTLMVRTPILLMGVSILQPPAGVPFQFPRGVALRRPLRRLLLLAMARGGAVTALLLGRPAEGNAPCAG